MEAIARLLCERFFFKIKSQVNHHFHWEAVSDPLLLAAQSSVT